MTIKYDRVVEVSQFLKDPATIHDVAQNDIILMDMALMGGFPKMIEAINLLDELGWETISLSAAPDAVSMHALARRIRKPKN
jgi:hypothetical protein